MTMVGGSGGWEAAEHKTAHTSFSEAGIWSSRRLQLSLHLCEQDRILEQLISGSTCQIFFVIN